MIPSHTILLAQIPQGIDAAAKTMEQASPIYILSLIAIVFAWTIHSLFKLILKNNDRHHEDWIVRDKSLSLERELRHKEMLEMGEKMTTAMTGVKLILENCHRKEQ